MAFSLQLEQQNPLALNQKKKDQHAYNENKFLHKVSKKEVLQMLANTKYTNISGSG